MLETRRRTRMRTARFGHGWLIGVGGTSVDDEAELRGGLSELENAECEESIDQIEREHDISFKVHTPTGIGPCLGLAVRAIEGSCQRTGMRKCRTLTTRVVPPLFHGQVPINLSRVSVAWPAQIQ